MLADVPSYFPTAEAGRRLQPAQLRRQIPRAAADSPGARRIGERAGGGDGVGARRAESHSLLPKRRALDVRQTASYYGLGVTLGNAEVRLAELTAAYATFARQGLPIDPLSIKQIDTGDGLETGRAQERPLGE